MKINYYFYNLILTPDIGHVSHSIIQLAMQPQCQSVVIRFYRFRFGTAEPAKFTSAIFHTQIMSSAAVGPSNLFRWISNWLIYTKKDQSTHVIKSKCLTYIEALKLDHKLVVIFRGSQSNQAR